MAAAKGTRDAALADLDGDGDLDLVLGYLSEPDAALINAGDGRGWTRTTFGDDAGLTYWLAVADVDATGFPDVVEVKSEGRNTVFLNRPR